jgi:hypothetical protein
MRPYAILAAVLRNRYDEHGRDSGPWSGLTRTCQCCQRETIEHLEDGWCSQCNGADPDDSVARAQGRRWLYKTTAEHLRKMGFPDRARFWEDKLAEM